MDVLFLDCAACHVMSRIMSCSFNEGRRSCFESYSSIELLIRSRPATYVSSAISGYDIRTSYQQHKMFTNAREPLSALHQILTQLRSRVLLFWCPNWREWPQNHQDQDHLSKWFQLKLRDTLSRKASNSYTRLPCSWLLSSNEWTIALGFQSFTDWII